MNSGKVSSQSITINIIVTITTTQLLRVMIEVRTGRLITNKLLAQCILLNKLSSNLWLLRPEITHQQYEKGLKACHFPSSKTHYRRPRWSSGRKRDC